MIPKEATKLTIRRQVRAVSGKYLTLTENLAESP